MCGIIGIYSQRENSKPIDVLAKDMLSRIAHRGPDDEGMVLFSEEGYCVQDTPITSAAYQNAIPYLNYSPQKDTNFRLVLGHRRLSIVDQSDFGHQPLCTEEENYWITYNGEVYNYKALRTQLEALGIRFYSNTDSEVVLNSYKVWGKECLQKFNGMFSFVIYNRKEDVLFAARDAFGVKPFYFLKTEQEFVFASEQKAFLSYTPYAVKLNQKSLFNYLTIGQIEEEENNFWDGISELQPGHFLEFCLKTQELKIKRYYELQFNLQLATSYSAQEEKIYIEKIEHLLCNSIKNHLKADVEVGSCLSGGIDSSVIVGMVAATLNDNRRQHTFSSVFEGQKGIDESRFARMVSDQHKTIWNSVTPTAHEFAKDIKELCYTQDIPFFSSSTYSQFRVMKMISEKGIKVTLDGQGADELFSGYNSHYSSHFWELVRALQLKSATKNIGVNSIAEPIKYMLAKEATEVFKGSFQKKKTVFNYLSTDFSERFSIPLTTYGENWKPSLNEQLYTEFNGTRLKNLMRTGDRNSMHFSVESRMPFVDDIPLVEYVFSIPGSYKIKNKVSKYLLREAALMYLPKEVYQRQDKIGFATPEKQWLKTEKETLLELLPKHDDEFVKWTALKKHWDKELESATDTSGIWRLMNFGIWKKGFLEKGYE